MLLIPMLSFSQNKLDAEMQQKVDKLFVDWQNSHQSIDVAHQPGGAAIIVYNGEVVYQNAFGTAQLEYKAPITTSTKFQLGAMAKHITGFAVLYLEEQGKLSLKDDIRKYISELPDLGQTITINHLMSHTSGLDDFMSYKDLIGWGEQDALTWDDALSLMQTQDQLAFKPGTEFSYNYTNTLLLTKIVEKASGQSFVDYTQKEIFEPLGMKNTHFVESHQEDISNLAHAYIPLANRYVKGINNTSLTGITNLYASVEDLGIWELNLVNPKIGSKELMKKLDTPTSLDNGQIINLPRGMNTYGQQFIHAERGVPKLYMYGGTGGYASSVFRFSTKGFTGIALSSDGRGYTGMFGMGAAYLFLEDQFLEPASVDFANLKTIKLTTKELQNYCAHFWDDKASYMREIQLKNDTLRYFRPDSEFSSDLLPVGNDKFQMVAGGDEQIFVEFKGKGDQREMIVYVGKADPIAHQIIKPQTYSETQLNEFKGTYYCPQLNTGYTFDVKDGKLVANHLRLGEITFSPVTKDKFKGDFWNLSKINFQRDSKQQITGFKVSTDNVRNLNFTKIGNKKRGMSTAQK